MFTDAHQNIESISAKSEHLQFLHLIRHQNTPEFFKKYYICEKHLSHAEEEYAPDNSTRNKETTAAAGWLGWSDVNQSK